MAKRPADSNEQLVSASASSAGVAGAAAASDSPSSSKKRQQTDASQNGGRRAEDDGMGEFEDAFEDEVEEEEYDDEGEQDDMSVDGEITRPEDDEDEDEDDDDEGDTKVYLPSQHKDSTNGESIPLEPDLSAYEMLHRLNITWPCLSFDILRDTLGVERGQGGGGFPHTAYLVAGTQADQPKNNEVLVMKASSMHRTNKDGDLSDDEDDNDENDLDEDAVLEYRSIPIMGGVNRVRAAPVSDNFLTASAPSDPYPVAVWSELGKVHIYDVRPLYASLERGAGTYDKKKVSTPLHSVEAHSGVEGYALDWAGSTPSSQAATNGSAGKASTLRLLSGDVNSKIILTTTNNAGCVTHPSPFTSHTASVEDIQWSPTEQTVFASCSADASIRIWDVRVKSRKSALCVDKAHDSDVNVISWNKKTEYLLLSGGDDGALKVWDMRMFKSSTGGGASKKPDPVAAFKWHTAEIDSVEWHPTEESVFAASGRDDQVTLWDLSVEADDEETGLGTNSAEMRGPDGKEVPNQLLFCHHGASEIKEVHWHAQVPGMLVTTSADGFHFFKTISV